MTEQKYGDSDQETMRKGVPPDPEIMKRFQQNRTEAVAAFKDPNLSYEEAMEKAIGLLGKADAEDLYYGLARKK